MTTYVYSLEFRVHATTKINYNSCMQTRDKIACNNNNMRNPSLHFISWGYACYYCCMYISTGVFLYIRLVFLRMATSEPLPQRPTRKSRRLRGQEPQQATPEKVVGSVATPGPHPSLHLFHYGVTHNEKDVNYTLYIT